MTPRGATAPYLYRVFDPEGLIYVGATSRLWRRLAEHRRNSWWAGSVAHVKAQVCPDIATARLWETRAILAEKPRWNLLERQRRLRIVGEQEFIDYVACWKRSVLHDAWLRDASVDWAATGHSGPAARLRQLERQFLRQYGFALSMETPLPLDSEAAA